MRVIPGISYLATAGVKEVLHGAIQEGNGLVE